MSRFFHRTLVGMEDTLARLDVLKYVLMHSRAVRLAGALVASGGLVGLIWKMALNRHRRNRLRHLRERKQEELRKEIEQIQKHVRLQEIRVCVNSLYICLNKSFVSSHKLVNKSVSQ